MSMEGLAQILIDDGPGERRAIAVDAAGIAWQSFIDRSGFNTATAYGARVIGRVRAIAQEQGGAFLELETGEDAFLRVKGKAAFAEGADLVLRVEAEARHGKVARVQTTDHDAPEMTPFDAWCDQLPNGASLPISHDPDAVDAAFESISSQHVILPRGGRIWIEQTRALTAIDIDTAGRVQRGRANARAHAINREAVVTGIQSLLLRRLGGLVAIDCIGPVSRESATQLRSELTAAINQHTTLTARSEGPSQKMGVLIASLRWRFKPLDEILNDETGAPRPETELLSVLRHAVRDARASTRTFFKIHLGAAPHAVYVAHQALYDGALPEDVAGRLQIVDGVSERTEVRRV
ncbi:MAG: ribonuclease E/G [Pseudomonadota bacterium]